MKKARYFGSNMRGPASTRRLWRGGFSTLELLIAFAVLTLSITAVVVVVFGNQAIAIDTQTNIEALGKAEAQLEQARALSRSDFNSVNTTSVSSPSGPLTYEEQLAVTDVTQCRKEAKSTVTWAEGARQLHVDLATILTDVAGFLALGGDCPIDAPSDGWNPPVLYASDTISPGKLNAIDALKKIAYLGGDKIPYFYIADTRATMLGDDHFHNPPIISFDNSFNAAGDQLDEIYDLDAYEDLSAGNTYVFLATASSTAQLVVLDVTDIHNPKIAKNPMGIFAKRKLNNVAGSYPEGWRLYYYDKRVYIVTRETSGPEFHIFNVSDPTDPTEIGPGTKLKGCTPPNGTTANALLVRDGIAYFADDKAACELMVYDVSDPLHPAYLANASVDLPGTTNGLSLFLLGNKLFFGREKSSGSPELYIFDATDPKNASGGLPQIGATDPHKELNTDITDIYVVGKFGFLATPADSSNDFKVWDFSNPESIQSINLTFNFGNKPSVIDYDSNFVYAAGLSTPNFEMLYSP